MATLPDAQYGEQAAFQQAQRGAPMGAPQGGPAATTPASGPSPALTPLHAPSARPDEEVTAGAELGPGVGPDALGITPPQTQTGDLEKLRAYLPAFIAQANREESTQEFRNFVRALRAQIR